VRGLRGSTAADRQRCGLAGDLAVPLPPRQEPTRLLAEDDHIQQLDRCLTDEAMPLDLRVGGALVLLFGMLVSRITQLTKDDVIEDGQGTCLAIDGHRLMLPPRLADLVRRLRDQDEPRWTLGRLGSPRRGSSQARARPARPWTSCSASASTATASTPTPAATPPASPWPPNCLPRCWPDLTGISISTAERWSQWAKRDRAAYVGQRAADDREDIYSRKPAKQTR
jgi:hypothetical protein